MGKSSLVRGASGSFQTRFLGPKPAVVDSVALSSSEPGTALVKAMVRDFRRPEVGDKFSSRHGQKGVCGLLVHQNDLPFNELGMCPDIIMNPHGFPSRMTVGKLIELIAGKKALFEGKLADSTSFCKNSTKEICASLVQHGFNFSGKDMFYSGTTGEVLTGYVFFGPIYY
ncbi:RNA polymerase beta subunit, partial [Perkinsela sp. CCAP 1560/4]